VPRAATATTASAVGGELSGAMVGCRGPGVSTSRQRECHEALRLQCESYRPAGWREADGRGESHCIYPQPVGTRLNAAYPPAFKVIQQDGMLPPTCTLRQCKYLNNMVEQDHRSVKRRVNPGLGFGSFPTAQRTLQGYEVMPMIQRGQLHGTGKEDILTQNRIIAQMFGLVA
jgi:hypothetical protein